MLGISSTNVLTGRIPYYIGSPLIILMKFTAGTYISTTAIHLVPYKTLNVMLEEINTETNKYNGVPSTVSDVIDVETSNFAEIVTVIREFPCFKLFRVDMINELKISIADE